MRVTGVRGVMCECFWYMLGRSLTISYKIVGVIHLARKWGSQLSHYITIAVVGSCYNRGENQERNAGL